jgi:hypothetical protein
MTSSKFNKVMRRLLPAINIHIWGGLGSQLYALALQIDLSKKYQFREIKFLFHTSGVTRREPELNLFSNSLITKEDFEKKNKTSVKLGNNKLNKISKLTIKYLLELSGFTATCNDNTQYDSLKPWVLSIRGHYSKRRISYDSSIKILQLLNMKNNSLSDLYKENCISLQYRLGDLLSLDNKSPIDFAILKKTISKVLDEKSIYHVNIYSDSKNTAIEHMNFFSNKVELEFRDVNAKDTIMECTFSQVFIGTNSKISIWIAFLRIFQESANLSYLPSSMSEMFSSMISQSDLIDKIQYY